MDFSSGHLHKLDNPAWNALSETQSVLGYGGEHLKRYRPDIVSFAAISGNSTDIDPDTVFKKNEALFIIGDLPTLPGNYQIEFILPCSQMVCEQRSLLRAEMPVAVLGEEHETAMAELVNLVQPGYYLSGTRLMGDYYGIWQQGRLVAMAGERMRMDGLTEISAVVTHPDYTGRGFAQCLVAQVVNKNIDAGVIPFLHVSETNQRAIGIYERLHFVRRRSIPFTKIKRVG